MSTRIVRFAIQWVLAFVVATNLVAADASDEELQAAIRGGDPTRLQALIARDGGPSSNTATLLLIWAAADGNRPVLEKLLVAGVPINAISSRSAWLGETALMGAVARRQKDTVAYLLQKGANPNVVGQSFNGNSTRCHLALFGAVYNGDLEIARTLLRATADPNLVGAYAVSFANEQGDIEMYNLLLQHGGRLPEPNQSKQPPASEPPVIVVQFKKLGFAELLPGAAGVSKTSAANQRQRLAIVADDLNGVAADLLVAALSKQPRFELVERQELDRVLVEQKLSKQFAADAANFRQVATFLRADVLALIRTRKVAGLEVVETRFVRVDAGIVLDTSYRPAPLALANWAEEMAQRAGDVAERVTRPNAIAVSMLDVHATVRAAAARPLERTLTLLLRERLV
ncbi:MAG: hypothetical protein RIQ79_2090, partial [Verrucomicrobiota bacterium]